MWIRAENTEDYEAVYLLVLTAFANVEQYSVVLGSEKYYPKAGYVPAEQFGIKAPFEVPSENFMAYDLQGNSDRLNGIVQYAKEFFKVLDSK